MHILITKYFNKEITTGEKAELFSLMQTDKELHKEFVSMQNLSALSASLPAEDDEMKAVSKLLQFKQAHKQANTKFFLFMKMNPTPLEEKNMSLSLQLRVLLDNLSTAYKNWILKSAYSNLESTEEANK